MTFIPFDSTVQPAPPLPLGQVEYAYCYPKRSTHVTRLLTFQRVDENDPETVYAVLYALNQGNEEREIQKINGRNIKVEMMNHTAKREAMKAESLGKNVHWIPNVLLSELSAQKQCEVLHQLEPSGKRRILLQLINPPLISRENEIQHLTIFDPE